METPHFDSDNDAPFGTVPRHAPLAIWLWGLFYAAWLVLLLWMALYHSGG